MKNLCLTCVNEELISQAWMVDIVNCSSEQCCHDFQWSKDRLKGEKTILQITSFFACSPYMGEEEGGGQALPGEILGPFYPP
jgi:hypothetical protein